MRLPSAGPLEACSQATQARLRSVKSVCLLDTLDTDRMAFLSAVSGLPALFPSWGCAVRVALL